MDFFRGGIGKMRCPKCAADIEIGSNFCPKCGQSIAPEALEEDTKSIEIISEEMEVRETSPVKPRDEFFKAVSGETETKDEYRNLLVRKNMILQLLASIPHFFVLYASWKLCDGIFNIIVFFFLGVILFGISMSLMGFNHVRKDIKTYDRVLKEAGKKEAIVILENRKSGYLSYVVKTFGLIIFTILLLGLIAELHDNRQENNGSKDTELFQASLEADVNIDVNTDDTFESYLEEAVRVKGEDLVKNSQNYQYRKIIISTNVTTRAMAGLAEYTDNLKKFSQDELSYLNNLPVWFSCDEFLGTYLLVYDDRYDESPKVTGGESFTTYGIFLGLSEDNMPVIIARYIDNGEGVELTMESEKVRALVNQDFLKECKLYTSDQIDSDATLKGMPTYGFGDILYKEFANGADSLSGYEYVVDAGVQNQPSFIIATAENFNIGDTIVV